MQTLQQPERMPPSWVLPSSFTVCLDMLSDWHVGSGTGRPGSIDRLVARDMDDLPYVPAKTLTGIWRDALEQLTLALDNGQEGGEWAQWVDRLFGSQPALAQGPQTDPPRPAALTVSPARLPPALRERLTGPQRTLLRQALTFVKPGVAIDPRRGQALPRHLRFEEMARTGTLLTTHCTLHLPGSSDQHAAASALLLASAKLVERLGGKRRRGAGRCTFTVAAGDSVRAIQWLHDHPRPPETLKATPQALHVSAATITMQHQLPMARAWRALPIMLCVETPIVVAARTLGNVTATLDYVPGTLLLPHVTRVLQAIGYHCRAAVAAGELQILPATLDIDGSRGLPVPHVLFRHKEDGGFDMRGTVLNRLLEPPGESQLKGFRSGYIGAWQETPSGRGHLPRYDTVPRILLTHNTVADDVQRPTSDVGGIYSREAIAPRHKASSGVVLRTELRLHPAVAATLEARHATWWEQLSGSYRLGVSRKDDYGLVHLTVQGPPQSIASYPPLDLTDPRRLTVWLLSDVLLRDDALRPAVTSDRLRTELEGRLGVTLKPAHPLSPQCFHELIQVHRLESWHTKWGQPRPSLIAMAAGSCAVFEVVEGPELQREKLGEVEATGIGERRGEGYGQLCFNAALLTAPLHDWSVVEQHRDSAVTNADTGTLPPLTAAEDAYAYCIELAAWREALQRVVLAVAADEKQRQTMLGLELNRQGNHPPQSHPPLSQLGSLRTVLQDLQSPNDARVLRWLQHLKDTPNRRNKWPEEALPKLTRLLTEEAYVWEVMGTAWQGQELPQLTDRPPAALRVALWAEAVQALVDACLRAHKRDTEPVATTPEEEARHGA